MARKRAQTLNYADVAYDHDPKVPGDKEKSIKHLFLSRFAKESRTLEATYNAWSMLTFDPNMDDIE